MKKGITIAGTIVIDKNKYIDHFPKEGQLVNILKETTTYGGLVSNTAVNLAALNANIAIYAAGNVGNDEEGHKLIKYYQDKGINTDLVIKHNNYQSATVDAYVNTSNNERTFFANLAVNDIFGKDFPEINTEYLHIGYLLLMPYLDKAINNETRLSLILKKLSEKGVKISIDLITENSKRYNKVVIPSLKYVNYVIINEMEASYLTNINVYENDEVNISNLKLAAKQIKDYGVKDLVVIHSPFINLLFDGNDYVLLKSLNLPKDFIVASIGAGDAFCAGVLHGIIKNESYIDMLRLATALAATVLNSDTSHTKITGIKNLLKLEDKFGRYK